MTAKKPARKRWHRVGASDWVLGRCQFGIKDRAWSAARGFVHEERLSATKPSRRSR